MDGKVALVTGANPAIALRWSSRCGCRACQPLGDGGRPRAAEALRLSHFQIDRDIILMPAIELADR